jgi:hypothetical protein
MSQSDAVREDGIDEDVRRPVDLPLRQGPELDGLYPSRECVRQAPQAEDAGGAGEQEPAGTRVGVNRLLDREQQFGHPLNLIDDHEVSAGDELGRVVLRSLPGGGAVQAPPFGFALLADLRHEGALAALAGAVDENHPGVGQCFPDLGGGMPRNEAPDR